MRRIGPVILLFFFLFVSAGKISAQDTSSVVTKTRPNFKQEIIVGDKKYRVWDNYVTFGVGSCLLTNNPYFQLAFGIDFNFHIKQIYFNGGGLVSGQSYGLWNNENVHMGYIPIRHQNEKYSYAIVLDASYSSQRRFAYPPDVYIVNPLRQFGFYTEFQFDKKIDYSTGYGACFFMDLTPKNQIFGLRIDGYLSGGYRGYAPGHYKKPIQ
ncbi:MAG TPA: hypothetical protein VL651_16160 [Bacteroidia bacterium]|jgi:hypothetical protein|nr:hypothetical protein [Bacteroidia bacterium]